MGLIQRMVAFLLNCLLARTPAMPLEVAVTLPYYQIVLLTKRRHEMSGNIKRAAGSLNTEMILRKFKVEDSLGPEDDYMMGFLEGQRAAEFQRRLFIESLESLISIAFSWKEFHSGAHARYLLKRLGEMK